LRPDECPPQSPINRLACRRALTPKKVATGREPPNNCPVVTSRAPSPMAIAEEPQHPRVEGSIRNATALRVKRVFHSVQPLQGGGRNR
jgi:hypothetical protein